MSFKLLWCERCGKADDVARSLSNARMPDIATESGPLRCVECGEYLTLLDCEVTGTLEKGKWVAYMGNILR